MKTILIFHPVAPAAELLRGTLTSMGYPAKVVGPKEYGQLWESWQAATCWASPRVCARSRRCR